VGPGPMLTECRSGTVRIAIRMSRDERAAYQNGGRAVWVEAAHPGAGRAPARRELLYPFQNPLAGKSSTSSIDPAPVSSMSTRSSPTATPPAGGIRPTASRNGSSSG
jgi:hypothetical protein